MELDPSIVQGGVGDHDSLDKTQTRADLTKSADDGRGRHASNLDDVTLGQGGASDRNSGAGRHAGLVRDGRLDGIAGNDVDPVQPRGGEPGERGARR